MDRQVYTIKWICIVKTKYVTTYEFLDEEYLSFFRLLLYNSNSYIVGCIGDHYVVITCLPKDRYGIVSVVTVTKDIFRSFESIHIELMMKIVERDVKFEIRHPTEVRGGRMSSKQNGERSLVQVWKRDIRKEFRDH